MLVKLAYIQLHCEILVLGEQEDCNKCCYICFNGKHKCTRVLPNILLRLEFELEFRVAFVLPATMYGFPRQ